MPFHVELSHAGSGRKWDVQVSEACSFGQLKVRRPSCRA